MTTQIAVKSPAHNELQPYGSLVPTRLALSENDRKASVESLSQLLADVITLRDLYKKHHWQTSGTSFYSIHLLFDKHAGELTELADTVAERIQTLGGVAIAMGSDIAMSTLIPPVPRGRESVTGQLRRLLHAHEIVLEESRAMARATAKTEDFGTNDIIVSDVIRLNEIQSWFLSAHILPNFKE
jgi:starvation-inducible DNA-binding protein